MGFAISGSDAREGAGDLGLQHLFSFAGFAFFENFANANYRHDAVLQRCVQFLVYDGVGFREILPALGVANERVRAANGSQLADGSFAGIGAFFGEVDILRADGDV